jgi:heptosyltransferase I
MPREQPRSVLIVMLSAVGDAVLVLPVINALRRAFSRVHITWVLQPEPHSLVAGHAAVDEFVLFQRGRRGRTLGSALSAIRGLHAAAAELRRRARNRPGGRFDLLLDLQVYLKAGILTALAPSTVKLGFDRRRARDLNWLFTNRRIPRHPQGYGHVQDQYLEFLQHLGVDPEPVEYGLSLTADERRDQKRFYDRLDRPACAVVAASSDTRKNWTLEGYVEVIRGLESEFGLQPLLVGGHSPAEETMASTLLEAAGGRLMDVRGGGLRRLLWLLDGSALVISPDTGPLHMARAVETPVVGLFGFTNPRRSGPYRRFTELTVDGYARYAGEDYGLTMHRRAGGMGRITAPMVLEKVELALRQGAR